MSDIGMKHDTGKAPIARGFARYFPRAIESVALISQFGFDKYKEWGGWKKVPDAYDRYDDAHGRHDLAKQAGETHCQESGKLHLAHRAWNALATLELYLIDIEQGIKDKTWADAANEPFEACGQCKTDTECTNRAYCLGGVPPLVITAVTAMEKSLYGSPVEYFKTCARCQTPKWCTERDGCALPISSKR